MYHGIINVYKEPGFTSFDVVAKLRGICGQKKIGHTGTLDPDAEGVLPVCLGQATKVCDILTDTDKEYQAVMLLGVETDTQDTSGAVLAQKPTGHLTEEQVREVISHYIGDLMQVPPMYSALKVNGQKLCDLARAGITVERKSRPITIYRIHVDAVNLPRVTMTVCCSKGTYIRTLCHDIGQELGCGAAMEHLIRTRAAGYLLKDAFHLSQLQELKDQGRLSEAIRTIGEVFSGYPAYRVTEAGQKLLYNGNALAEIHFETAPSLDTPIRVCDTEGAFCALYQYSPEKKCLKPVKMFLP